MATDLTPTFLFIDMGTAFVTCAPEVLSDGSVVWNLHFRGNQMIHCLSRERAREALAQIAAVLQLAVGEEPLVL